jgi:murein DD-endopeptidase MepM/ murein hydrolase activator NlpD
VKKGTVIATVGSSGGSIAPHLHYEVIRNGKQVDPVHFMIDGVTSREYSVLRTISQKENQSLD